MTTKTRRSDENDDANEDESPVDLAANGLNSWLVGVAFGRFDPRLATGERSIPPEPEPFDPLPSRSPGMWPEGEEPADLPTFSSTTKAMRTTSLSRSCRRGARSRRRAGESSRLAREGVLPAAHQDVQQEPSQGADLLAARDAVGELLGVALHPRIHQGHALPRPERLCRAQTRARRAPPSNR